MKIWALFVIAAILLAWMFPAVRTWGFVLPPECMTCGPVITPRYPTCPDDWVIVEAYGRAMCAHELREVDWR